MRRAKRTVTCLFTVFVMAYVSTTWAGQMRFAKAPITDPKTGSFTADFKAGDPIYGVVEFDDTLGDEKGKLGEWKAQVIQTCISFPDKSGVARCLSFDIKPDQMSRKWIAFTIISGQFNPSDLQTMGMLESFGELNHAPQKVRVAAGLHHEVEGFFTLDLTAGVEGYKALQHSIDMNKPLPVARMKDAKLEKELTALVKARESSDYEIYKVVITSDEWALIRHTITNEVLGRTLGFAVFAKKRSTDECMVRAMGGGEDATSKGHFGKLNVFTGESDALVPCERIATKK